jgi:hypothetical protein
MNMRTILISTITVLASSLCGMPPAAADSMPLLPAATTLDDSQLATVRGKFILAAGPQVAARSIVQGTTPASEKAPLTALPQSRVASPLANVQSAAVGTTVAYFGISMISSWSVGTGAQQQGVSVGLNIAVNPSSGSAGVTTWSTSENGGLPNTPGNGNTVTGSPLQSSSAGIGQTIQVAGNGNTVNNEAVISVGAGSPGQTAVPNSNTCGAQCTAMVNGINVAINTPQGSVGQSIGGNGVQQSVQIWSDMNTVVNQLGIRVQTAPTSPLNQAGIGLILQTLNGIR